MDAQRFDRLTRMLGEGGTRRAVLRRLLGGTAAGALALAGAGRAAAQQTAQAEGCLPIGRRCGGDTGRSCADCCTGFAKAGPSGIRVCSCRPDGEFCFRSDQCCSGTCPTGVCGGGFRSIRGTCESGQGFCRRSPFITCNGNDGCACFQTDNRGLICADLFDGGCLPCASDAKCREVTGDPRAVCGRGIECCGGSGRTGCVVPCPRTR